MYYTTTNIILKRNACVYHASCYNVQQQESMKQEVRYSLQLVVVPEIKPVESYWGRKSTRRAILNFRLANLKICELEKKIANRVILLFRIIVEFPRTPRKCFAL